MLLQRPNFYENQPVKEMVALMTNARKWDLP